MHDHAASERNRQDAEWRGALDDARKWKAEAFMAVGALREIKAAGVGLVEQGRIRDIVDSTLKNVDAVRKLESR